MEAKSSKNQKTNGDLVNFEACDIGVFPLRDVIPPISQYPLFLNKNCPKITTYRKTRATVSRYVVILLRFQGICPYHFGRLRYRYITHKKETRDFEPCSQVISTFGRKQITNLTQASSPTSMSRQHTLIAQSQSQWITPILHEKLGSDSIQ